MPGWERTFIPLIGQLVDAYKSGFQASFEPPRLSKVWLETREENKGQGIKQDSPNHRYMAVAYQLGRAAAYGTKDEYDSFAEIAHRMLDLHLNEGLWTTEQCTGRPHGGMYLDGDVAFNIAIQARGDSVLGAKVDEISRRVMAYLVHTSSPGIMECWCAGERMPKGPVAQQQNAWLRQMKQDPPHHTGELSPGQKWSKNIEDDAWVSLKGLMALQERGCLFGGARDLTPETCEFPKVVRPVTITRRPNFHVVEYRTKPEDKGTCWWVKVDYRERREVWKSTKPGDVYRGVEFRVT